MRKWMGRRRIWLLSLLAAGVVLVGVGSWFFLGTGRERLWLVQQVQQWWLYRNHAEQVRLLKALDVQRSGYVRVRVFDLTGQQVGFPVSSQDPVAHYALRSPVTAVWDTDIRGFLDGEVKYPFNQATAYHMRVGRRYNGEIRGEYELKRSLIRWQLPPLPSAARVVSAAITLNVEPALTDSPPLQELHFYLYPLGEEWSPGYGGVDRNSFSPAAPGEVTWNEARTGEEPWPAPGALAVNGQEPAAYYQVQPLATAHWRRGQAELVFQGPRLAEYIDRVKQQGRASINVLVKLDDTEEDAWGTETGIFTSDFGDDKDFPSKRPKLDLWLGGMTPVIDERYPFVLEAGMRSAEYTVSLPGGRSLVAVEIEPTEPMQAPPEIWVQTGPPSGEQGEWERYVSPLVTEEGSLTIQLNTALNAVEWGDPFQIDLLETWVQPGPRSEQVPEILLLAPSGRLYRVLGTPVSDVAYQIVAQPREVGLWRYLWSFAPMPVTPPNGHVGTGLFFVTITPSAANVQRLNAFAAHVEQELQSVPVYDLGVQQQINALVRLTSRFAYSGASDGASDLPSLRSLRERMADNEVRMRRSFWGRVQHFLAKRITEDILSGPD